MKVSKFDIFGIFGYLGHRVPKFDPGFVLGVLGLVPGWFESEVSERYDDDDVS